LLNNADKALDRAIHAGWSIIGPTLSWRGHKEVTLFVDGVQYLCIYRST